LTGQKTFLQLICVLKYIQGHNEKYDLPAKSKTDICTIMYTSGTTSEPKGVMISNETVVTVVSGINYSLKSINEEVISCFPVFRTLLNS